MLWMLAALIVTLWFVWVWLFTDTGTEGNLSVTEEPS